VGPARIGDSPVVPILLQERGIVASLFSRFDTTLFTSSTLSVLQIPQEDRQRISSRLADLDIILYDRLNIIEIDNKDAGASDRW
jgi:hypothetical protein